MGRARVLEEIRIMRFEQLVDRHVRGCLTQAEAPEMLGYWSGASGAGKGATGRWARRGSPTGGSADPRRGARTKASWRGRVLQIQKSPLRNHLARASVRLQEYPDGAVALFWAPQRIAHFPPPAAAPDDLAA